jgi:hypothetical protein
MWPEPTRRPRASKQVVDFPPHCGLSRRRLLFANIYRPFSKLGSSGAPATSATCGSTTRLASLDVVKGKANFKPLAIEEQMTLSLQLTLYHLPINVKTIRPRVQVCFAFVVNINSNICVVDIEGSL